jgi:thioredoxin-related protein
VRNRVSWAAAIAVAAALLLSQTGRAARNQAPVQPSATMQELIVLEAPNCTYCWVMRRDVLPSYRKSKHASELPIRFLDVNDPAADKLKLSAAVTIVPTVVLMREGAEIGRISGYMGPESFFQSVSRMVGAAAD